MLNRKEAYLCLTSMLRAREPKLLSAERAERMLDASSFEEAAKLLTDCGYDDMSQMSAKEMEKMLSGRRESIFSEIGRLCPDTAVVDFFRARYDCHNLKVLIKSEAMNTNAENLLSSSGRISGAKLKELYTSEKYGEIPGELGKAAEEAKSLLARTSNPQLADLLLDRAYFAELNAVAKESGNGFLKGYAALLTDTANLKSAVRIMRMGKSAELLSEALIPGGNTDVSRILSAQDRDSLLSLYSRSALEKAAQAAGAALEGGTQTAFELECDNAVNTYLKGAKLISFGPEPVIAYLAAVESEITAVRMILTGRLAGVRSSVIRERLRDMYA